MVFNSFAYIFFLALVVVLYWSMRRTRWQNLLLLAASYVFYAAWDWRFLGLILFSTTVDYFVARGMPEASGRGRRLRLALSLLVNLGGLGFFKYFNFFYDSTVGLLNGLGMAATPSTLEILLPLGISFYTLKALTYTIEVYRGKVSPTQSWISYALFVSFFPQLSAGPIERAIRLLPQIEAPRTIDGGRFEAGLSLILVGVVKKIAIADVAASLLDVTAFTETARFPGGDVLIMVYLFAIQLYADFSGYSDIARGSALLLGFETMENFNQPYFSPNVADFWRRWHISLSFWLRDYIFFPFSRAALIRTKRRYSTVVMIASNLVTMTISGLWHGANWTYIVWGLLHGVYLSVHRLLLQYRVLPAKFQSLTLRRLWYCLSVIVTFHLILFGWMIFRAPNLEQVGVMIEHISRIVLGGDIDGFRSFLILPTLLLFGVTLAIDMAQIIVRDHAFVTKLRPTVRTALYVVGILSMIFFAIKPYIPFIYFQF